MLKENTIFSQSDIEQNKVIAALCNFPLLFWLGFVTAKDSDYVKYNANHGLIFLIISVLIGFLTTVQSIVAHVAFLGGILSFALGIVCWALGTLYTISLIICIIFAVTGKTYEIPVLDTVKILK